MLMKTIIAMLCFIMLLFASYSNLEARGDPLDVTDNITMTIDNPVAEMPTLTANNTFEVQGVACEIGKLNESSLYIYVKIETSGTLCNCLTIDYDKLSLSGNSFNKSFLMGKGLGHFPISKYSTLTSIRL